TGWSSDVGRRSDHPRALESRLRLDATRQHRLEATDNGQTTKNEGPLRAMTQNPRTPLRGLVIFLLIIVPTLLFLAWSQASLKLDFLQPSNAQQTIVLLALSI